MSTLLQSSPLILHNVVRPQLEYGVSVWFPYRMKDIEAIERVQKRATKQIKQLKRLSYSDRLMKLSLPTLRYRRHRGDMIDVFKILHHVYDSDVCEGILKLSDNKKTRGHSLKLHAQQSRLDLSLIHI